MSKVRLFYTTGKQDIIEELWDKPDPNDDEIEVKSVLTGVCRSDIDMYAGSFQTLPKTIQGHEGLGIVTKVGKDVRSDVREGDFVATRGEPAFADYYNSKDTMFVRVPELLPKYILEPIACGINVATIAEPRTPDPILLLGSGFLATIVYTIIDIHYKNKVYVVGNANKEFWKNKENAEVVSLDEIKNKKFKHIIDLSDKPEYVNLNIFEERAIVVIAAEKHPAASISFAQFLWNAVDVKFPSPRNETFLSSMVLARDMVKQNLIDTDKLWTKSYARDTEVKKAFEEGLARPKGYSRGYIKW